MRPSGTLMTVMMALLNDGGREIAARPGAGEIAPMRGSVGGANALVAHHRRVGLQRREDDEDERRDPDDRDDDQRDPERSPGRGSMRSAPAGRKAAGEARSSRCASSPRSDQRR